MARENLPLYKTFTEQQRTMYKPFCRDADEFSTRIRVYQTPFMYDNVDVGDFYEIDAMKGIEFKADTGFITIREEKPIVAVTVVGSGCVPRGYNIVEWWDDGENIDNVDNRTVKRLRIDDLNGIHPSVWIHKLADLAFLKDVDLEVVSPGDNITSKIDLLNRLSEGFYQNLPLNFHENSAHFALGHAPVDVPAEQYAAVGHSFASLPPRKTAIAYPHKITIRCGCKETEDPGTKLERYPGDYAIRLVQVHVVA